MSGEIGSAGEEVVAEKAAAQVSDATPVVALTAAALESAPPPAEAPADPVLAGETARQNYIGSDLGLREKYNELKKAAHNSDPYAKEMGKCSKMESEPVSDPRLARRRMARAAVVVRSGGGHRVKLVGDHLADLAPLFARWADRLGTDLRVVATGGEAPWSFYRLPLTDQMIKPGSVCLFLCGSSGRSGSYEEKESYPDDVDSTQPVSPPTQEIEGWKRWRAGVEELESRPAPSELDGPEFPAFANIADDKKVFIGRVDGGFVYTMLYVPTKLESGPAQELPAGLVMIPAPARVADPVPPLEHFLDYVLERYEAILAEYPAEVAGEMTERSFREYCGDSKRKRERALRKEMDSANAEIRSLSERMTRLSRRLRDAQKDMAAVMSGAIDGELTAEMRKLERLVADGLYVGFKIRHGSILGLSSDVVIEHEGASHALGRFVVSVNKFGMVSMQSLSRPFPAHPHLRQEPSSFCLGATGGDIAKTIGAERYAAAFTLLRDYLGSYNPHDRVTALDICSGARIAPEEVSDDIRPGNRYDGAQEVAIPSGATPHVPWESERKMERYPRAKSEASEQAVAIQAGHSITLEQGMAEIREKIAESVSLKPKMKQVPWIG